MADSERDWDIGYGRRYPPQSSSSWRERQGTEYEKRGSYDSYRPNSGPDYGERPFRRRPTADDWFEDATSRPREYSEPTPRGHHQWKSPDYKLKEQRGGYNLDRKESSLSGIGKTGVNRASTSAGEAQDNNTLNNGTGRTPIADSQQLSSSMEFHAESPIMHENITAMEIDPPSTMPVSRRSQSERLHIKLPTGDSIKEKSDRSEGTPGLQALNLGEPSMNINKNEASVRSHQSDHAMPQGAVVDTRTSSPSRTSAGGNTPIVRTPVTSAFTVPALPGSFPEQIREGTSESQETLMRYLYQFSQTTTKLASVTVHRDLTKLACDKKEKDYQRWTGHHRSFNALGEQQEEEMKRMRREMEHLDEKVKKHEKARDQAIQVMAKAMLAVNTNLPLKKAEEDSGKVKRLETEIKDLRGVTNSIKTTLSNPSNSDRMYIKRLEEEQSQMMSDITQLRSALSSVESDSGQTRTHASLIARANNEITRLDARVEQVERIKKGRGKDETVVSPMETQNENFKQEISILQERVAIVSTLQSEIEKLKKSTKSTADALQLVREEVLGSGGENRGLFDVLDAHENSIEAHRTTLQGFHDDLDGCSKNITNLGTRLDLVESSVRSYPAHPTIRSLEEKVDEKLAYVVEGFEQFQKDQDTKDELVGKEIDAIQKVCSKLESNFQSTSENLEKALGLVQKTISSLQDEVQRSSSTNLAISNGINTGQPQSMQHQSNTVRRMDDVTAETSRDDHQRFVACETALLALQQRFNNIHTESLARNMIHQLKTMYPYPAETARDLTVLKDSYAASSQSLLDLSNELSSLKSHVDGLTPSHEIGDQIKKLQVKATQVEERLTNFPLLITRKTNEIDGSIKVLHERCGNHDERLARIDNVLETGKTELSTVKSDLTQLHRKVVDNEDTNILEIAALHEKLVLVDDQLGITEDGGPSLEEDTAKESTPVAASTGSGSRRSQPLDSEATENRTTAEPVMKKKLLIKKKGLSKRPRRASDGSESDRRYKRKTRHVIQDD